MWVADHFAFEVADLDRAIRFYRDDLGLKLLSREIDETHGEAFAFFELEGGNLELLALLDRPPGATQADTRPSNCPHVAIRVDDLNEAVAFLNGHNVPVMKGPLEIPGRVRWLYLSDPDGNVIEFVQWL